MSAIKYAFLLSCLIMGSMQIFCASAHLERINAGLTKQQLKQRMQNAFDIYQMSRKLNFPGYQQNQLYLEYRCLYDQVHSYTRPRIERTRHRLGPISNPIDLFSDEPAAGSGAGSGAGAQGQ